MKYNFKEIGSRIQKARKNTFHSQDKFLEELSNHGVNIGRSRLSQIENGSQNAFYQEHGLELLIAICEIFQWDMGYLLGEYEEKTNEKHFLHEKTGLSETALDILIPHSGDWLIDTLNLLLENYLAYQNKGTVSFGFLAVLSDIYEYLRAYALLKSEKVRYNKESALVRHDLKGIDTSDWDNIGKVFDAEVNNRTISTEKIKEDETYIRALRLNIYESLMRTVDCIAENQWSDILTQVVEETKERQALIKRE